MYKIKYFPFKNPDWWEANLLVYLQIELRTVNGA